VTSGGLPVPVIVSLVVTGAGLSGYGSALATRTPARVAGVLMALAGLTTVTTAVVAAAGLASGTALGLSAVLLALAVMTYPRVRLDWAGAVAVGAVVLAPLVLWGRDPARDDSLVVVITAVALLQVWWRLEGARPAERRALSWVLVAASAVSFAGLVVGMLEAPPVIVALFLPSIVLVGVAALLGAGDAGVLDVRGVVASLATNALAAVAVFAVFRLCLLVLQALGTDASAAPVAGIVAVGAAFLLEPLRRRLRLVADELLFGVRPDPLVAAGRVALGVGDDTQTALDTLRAALVLPFAELRVDGLPTTTSGTAGDYVHHEPLLSDGQLIGDLVVGLRAGDFSLSSSDATVLSLAAPLLAQTVRARALAEGLQQSRAAVAAVREEERQRLRRDLHDGLGPRLSGIAFHADAAQLSTEDPQSLVSHLVRIRLEAVTAMQEIRSLVQGLRPPALDEVGLAEAIRLQAAALRGDGGRPMAVDVSGIETPHLPAAVEVAAYRITIEALTNSARHSGGDRAWVSLRVLDGALHVSVRDSGTSSGRWTPGVGLTTMADRAGELGGSISVGAGEVRAVLPL
jgi:signal transduction histidine kinase